MEKILQSLQKFCDLDSSSHVLDVGSGLCRPLLHACLTAKVAKTTGIEIDAIKCMKATAFCTHVCTMLKRKGHLSEGSIVLPEIQCISVDDVLSLDPATHAYSFWEGVPTRSREALGRLFLRSQTLKSITVVQRSMRSKDPALAMDELYGFGPLLLVDSFRVSMSGSGRSFMAYIFKKAKVKTFTNRNGNPFSIAPVEPGVLKRKRIGNKNDDKAQGPKIDCNTKSGTQPNLALSKRRKICARRMK